MCLASESHERSAIQSASLLGSREGGRDLAQRLKQGCRAVIPVSSPRIDLAGIIIPDDVAQIDLDQIGDAHFAINIQNEMTKRDDLGVGCVKNEVGLVQEVASQ